MYPAWAPDGESLVCDAVADLVRVSSGGEVLARLVTSSAVVRPRFPVFSPDGSRIYFHGVQEDGSQGIWWIPPKGGSPHEGGRLRRSCLDVFGTLTVGLGTALSHARRVRERHLGDGPGLVNRSTHLEIAPLEACARMCARLESHKGVKAAADFHTQCELTRRSPPLLRKLLSIGYAS